jgi:hypothetical protein
MSTTRSPNKDDDAAYKVGYGKPPQHTRFAPGRSGNPKGRPKGVRNFGTDVKATLKAPVKVTRDGRPRKVSTQEAMLFRLREKALNGDARALDRLLQLAQTYNNEDVMADVASLGADDAMVLETYRARVLSRAAGSPLSAEGNGEGSLIAGSTDLGAETPTRGEGGAS